MVAYRKRKPAAPEELAFMALIKEQPYCACSAGSQKTPTECHHIISANKRMGNLYCLPLCGYHHRNVRHLRSVERELWEYVTKRLKITHLAWPESKIVQRRAP